MERRFGSFQRSIQLSDSVEIDKIQASFKDGVLVITLPRSEKEQARVIDVKSV
jgi:HSP20 family protein